MWSSCFPRGKQGSGRVTSTDVVKAPLRPGRNARGKWDVGAPHGVSHISSSNPPPGGGHSCNFENDPVENEGANHFSVSAEVARCLSATQRLPVHGVSKGWPSGARTRSDPSQLLELDVELIAPHWASWDQRASQLSQEISPYRQHKKFNGPE